MSFFENTRKPVGFGGKVMTAMMNIGHKPVAHWGLQFLKVSSNAKILDCGCGGGANIKKLLKKYPHSIVNGIDYSIVKQRGNPSPCFASVRLAARSAFSFPICENEDASLSGRRPHRCC